MTRAEPFRLPQKERGSRRLILNTGEVQAFDSVNLKLPDVDRPVQESIGVHEHDEASDGRSVVGGCLDASKRQVLNALANVRVTSYFDKHVARLIDRNGLHFADDVYVTGTNEHLMDFFR